MPTLIGSRIGSSACWWTWTNFRRSIVVCASSLTIVLTFSVCTTGITAAATAQRSRAWAERELRRRGVDLQGGRIRLLCFPRVLGYVFNPLSIWYCEHRDGSLRAVICEVRNTFGGMDHYVLAAPDRGPMDWRAEYRADKVFHVSPFLSQDMEYRFRFLHARRRGSASNIDEYEHDMPPIQSVHQCTLGASVGR